MARDSADGAVLYHHIRFSGLQPGTVYAYRLKGSAGWSEWLQFRTAAKEARPFRFLYLGFRTYTASGRLYDGFNLRRGADNLNRLEEITEPMIAVRTCTGNVGPDGGICVARGK